MKKRNDTLGSSKPCSEMNENGNTQACSAHEDDVSKRSVPNHLLSQFHGSRLHASIIDKLFAWWTNLVIDPFRNGDGTRAFDL